MNKKILIVIALLIIGIIIGMVFNISVTEKIAKTSPLPTLSVSKSNCIGDECLLDNLDFPAQKIPERISELLFKGLDDEYKALATYQAIMDVYGTIRPFVMIARAEQQHIVAMQGLFEKYGIQVPENPYIGKIIVPGTIQGACVVGVTAEKENVALYRDTLIPMVTEYPDITRVFTNLMNASEQRHLPAFLKCS